MIVMERNVQRRVQIVDMFSLTERSISVTLYDQQYVRCHVQVSVCEPLGSVFKTKSMRDKFGSHKYIKNERQSDVTCHQMFYFQFRECDNHREVHRMFFVN